MSIKKVIVVSLLALLVLTAAAVIGGAIYLRRYSKYAPYLSATSHIAIAQKLEASLQNRAEYTPPRPGQVTDDQVARFVRVESQVESAVRANAIASTEDPVSITRRPPPAVLPETRRQVERHVTALRRWRALAFFGL